jgi:uncharacterized protein YbbC (DUF1343 family)
MKLGITILLNEAHSTIKGKPFGLISHHAAVNEKLKETLLALKESGFLPSVLFAPEHGYFGLLEAGESFEGRFETKLGLRVESLYRGTQGLTEGLDLDARMRTLDTLLEGKTPNHSALVSLEALVFDLVDVGTRVYTYSATLVIALKACLEAGIPLIVLDRPNPIGGALEGPVLEDGFKSFVGIFPVALRHGMTLGELALLANERVFQGRAPLQVIPLNGWDRGVSFKETGLFWVPPSPHMPTLTTAHLYPGQVLLEGTNLSEGRGTTSPFELLGAPWISGYELTQRLEALELPGVRFKPVVFRPAFSKYAGTIVEGVRLFILNPDTFAPFMTTLAILLEIQGLYPGRLSFHLPYFDLVLGNGWLRPMIERRAPIKEILARTKEGLEIFERERKPFLLYD